jgi:hypothetical protein
MASKWTGWTRTPGEAWEPIVDADTRTEAEETLGCIPTAGKPVERIVLRGGKNPNQETEMDRFQRSEKLRAIVQELGPEVTQETLTQRAEAEGLGAVSRSSFFSCRRQVYGMQREARSKRKRPAKAERKAAAVPSPANGTAASSPAPALDVAEVITTVASLAARLGGRARLREVLDSLDRLVAT